MWCATLPTLKLCHSEAVIIFHAINFSKKSTDEINNYVVENMEE
jgi:hypothetical protein